jgi:ubiquinone/menaquinone biosynthesis C-methylase UbiE
MTMNEPDQGAHSSTENPGAVFSEAGIAEVWRSGAAMRAQALAAATELMLELADLKPGDRVLDVAAGTGEQTQVAARRVGPDGHVLATDIAQGMLDVAAEELRRAGLTNVETRVMDAQSLDLESDSFDAVISRMGIMLIPEREKALAEIRRVLKPGGKLSAIVWSTPERNLSTLLPGLIARRHAKLPPPTPGAPGMFALGSPGLLERTLAEAGFRDVAVQAVPAPRQFPSVGELTRYLAESTPNLREPLAKLDAAGRAAMLAEIEETMRQFVGPDGVTISGEVLVGVGTK